MENINCDINLILSRISENDIASDLMQKKGLSRGNCNYFANFFAKMKIHIAKDKEKFKKEKERHFFNDKPIVADYDASKLLILLNTPFVEASKQEKFKVFLKKLLLADYTQAIEDISFPYGDSDKDALADLGFVVVKFATADDAKNARHSVDGKNISKKQIAMCLLYEEFKLLSSLSEEIDKAGSDDAAVPVLDLKVLSPEMLEGLYAREWNMLEEMFVLNYKAKSNPNAGNLVALNRLHYMKKENYQSGEPLGIGKGNSVNWSPQGTFLVYNDNQNLDFYGGSESLRLVHRLPAAAKEFVFSHDEKYLITFLGLGKTDLVSDVNELREIVTRQNVFFWDIRNKEVLKSLKINYDELFENFKWSPESKFLGRLKKDVLMVYESPEFKQIKDTYLDKRQPLCDKVSSYFWFPKNSGGNYIMAVSVSRKNKKIDTTFNFYEIPSRRQCPISIPLSNIELISHSWHPNGKTLMMLLKTANSNQWSIRVVNFNYSNFTHISKTYDVILTSPRPSQGVLAVEKNLDFSEVCAEWMVNGSEVLILAKKRLLLPMQSTKEKKITTMDEGWRTSIFMYSFNEKDLKLTLWEKDKLMKSLKYNNSVVSTNGRNFLLYNDNFDEPSGYGEAILYAIDNSALHNITKVSFGENFLKVKFDQSGRFFAAELNRGFPSYGTKIFSVDGNIIGDIKAEHLNEVIYLT